MKKRGFAAIVLALSLLLLLSLPSSAQITGFQAAFEPFRPLAEDLRDAAAEFGEQAGLIQDNEEQQPPAPVSSQQDSDVFASCGNNICESGESTSSCPADCSGSSPSPPPSISCGNGICDAGENISTCFIDCKTGSSGNSCSEITPLQDDLHSISGETASAPAPSDMPISALPVGTDSKNIVNLPDGGRVAVEEDADFIIEDAGELIKNSFLVQFNEKPEALVDANLNSEIRIEEQGVENLEGKIGNINTRGLRAVAGNVQKFFLKNELNAKAGRLEQLKESKAGKMAGHRARISAEHENFRKEIKRSLGPIKDVKEQFTKAFNGVLIEATADEAARLEKLPFVKSVSPERERTIDLMTSVGYINADSVWNLEDGNGNKITGLGTTIAIIDTGVDYTHPDLGGCFISPSGGNSTSTSGSGSSTSALPVVSPDDSGNNVAYTFNPVTSQVAFADSVAASGGVVNLPQYVSQLSFSRLTTAPDSIKIVSSSPGFDINRNGRREFLIRRDLGDIWKSTFEFYEKAPGNNNNFNLAHTIALPGTIDSYYPDGIGDSDGDNLTELAVYGRTQNNFYIRLYESASITGFPSNMSWQLPDGWWAVGAKIADTDNDGKKEVVIAGQTDETTHRIAIYESTANNAYQQTYFQSFPAMQTSQAMAVLDDVDNDGRAEIFYSGLVPGGSRIYAVESTGNNAYQQVWSYDMMANDSQLINTMGIIPVGDTDGDGRKEFLAGGRKTVPDLSFPMFSVFFLFESMAGNNFAKVAEFWLPMGFWDSSAANVADVDGDGRNEIILSAGSTLKVYKNNNSIWQEAWTTTSADDPADIGIGDYNGNGKSEIIFEEGTSTAIYESTGSAPPPPQPICGNGICESGETSASCPADCAPTPPPSNSTNTTATCKVIGGYDFYNNDANPMDDHGHGTHVASTAAGNGVLKGVAPDAKILAYKVCSSGGSCPEADIIAGIERALDPNQDGNFDDRADVISISLGGGGTPDDPDALAVDNAFANGVVVSVSAGNSGPNAGTVKCPSCARNSISVAAWCKPEDVGVSSYCSSQIASFSSRGPVAWSGGTLDKPDISAPGVKICAAQWQNAWASSQCLDNGHTSISGTSMAAPHISGAAALVKQAHPSWTSQQIKDALVDSAVDLGLDKYTQGAGLVDVLAAVQQSNTFPQAAIDTGGKIFGAASIMGTASGSNFTQYILEYAPQSSSAYSLITSSNAPVANSVLGIWDTGNVDDGFFSLRLTVSNSIGETNQKVKLVEVDNVAILNPENGFSTSNGPIPVSGTVLGNNFNSYVIEHGQGSNPPSWSSAGVNLANPSGTKSNELLGTWNASVTVADYYTIRLTATYNDGRSITDSVTIFIDPSSMAGFPVQLADSDLRSIAAADIDGDGEKEIIAGSRTPGKIYAINKDGSLVPGWPISAGASVFTKPAIADIDNDGMPEMIVAANKYYYLDSYNSDGSKMAGWPAYLGSTRYFVQGSPAIGDIDGDGDLEIVVGSEAYYASQTDGVHAFNSDGSPVSGWPRFNYAYNGTQVTPSLADLDGDGAAEIIAKQHSRIYAYRGDGSILPGFPVETGDIYWSATGIAAGDIDGNGDIELVAGMGTTLHVLNHDGTPLPGWPKTGFSSLTSPPSIGDMDGDGKLEVALSVQLQIYLFDYRGSQLWRKVLADPDKIIAIGNIAEHAAPLFIDIDHDGELEVVISYGTASMTTPTKIYAYNKDGTLVPGWPKFLGMIPGSHNNPYSTPLIDDLDNDGRYEMFAGFLDGKLYGWDLGSGITPDGIDWNQGFHDSRNTGLHEAGFYVPPHEVTYYSYQLTDNDCDVALSLSSSGNHTLYARNSSNVCDDTWDESVTASANSAKLNLTGLNQGYYAVKVDGYGAFSLTKGRFCRQDATVPEVSVAPLPEAINSDILISASVSDANGLSSCDVCLSNDGLCDSEWAPAYADFSVGDNAGTCSEVLNSTLLADGSYQVAFRAIDAQNNIGAAFKSTFLDRTPPVISQVSVPSAVEMGGLIPVTAVVTDNYRVANVTASLGFATTALAGSNSTYNGFLQAPQETGSYVITLWSYDTLLNPASANVTVRIAEIVNFSQPINIVTAQYSSGSSGLAVDHVGGSIHVVWEDAVSGTPNILYSRLAADGTIIELARNITNTVYNSKAPSVDASNGKVHIAWQDDRDGNKEIYYAKPGSIGQLRVTTNSFDSASPKVVADSSGAHIFWLDNRDGPSSMYYAFLDNNGNKIVQDTILAANVAQFDVASANPLRVAYVAAGVANHAHLQNFTLANITPIGSATGISLAAADDSYLLVKQGSEVIMHVIGSNITSIPVGSSTGGIAIAASDAVHVLWGQPAFHAKYDLDGNQLSEPTHLDAKTANSVAATASGVVAMTGTDALSLFTTAPVETQPPVIQYSVVSGLRSTSVVMHVSTNEPTLVTASFNGNGQADNMLSAYHELVLTGLSPSTAYAVNVLAADVAGNTQARLVLFTTEAQRNRPALPTTFFGRVIEQNGQPLSGIAITAKWTDTNGENHTTSVSSLTQQQAAILNSTGLAGYYVFNLGNILAAEGTSILLSAPDMTGPVSFLAQPGSSPINITNPLIVDRTPPVVSIYYPAATTYPTPFLQLNYSVNEAIQSAQFVLNGNDPVTITNLQNQNINFTARLGSNTLTVSATDIIGIIGSASATFTVEDKVPPVVSINAVSHARNITKIAANVSDSTNRLDRCEACIGQACEWQPISDNFGPGDFAGTCTLQWDTKQVPDGNYSVAFRAFDESGNIGTSQPITVKVDNTLPQKLATSVAKVDGQRKLIVSWPQSSDSEFKRYIIYRTSSPAIIIASISNRFQTSYADSDVISERTYGYAAVAEDIAGNEGAPEFRNETVADITPPSVSISQPQPITYNAAAVTLEYSMNEQGACSYRLNGGSAVPVSGTTAITAAEGTNGLFLSCTDLSNNTGNASVSFVVDTTPPAAIVPAVASIAGANSLRLTWAASAAADFKQYSIYRSLVQFSSTASAAKIATMLSKPSSQFIDTNLASQQAYYYAVTASDTIGNERTSVASVAGTVADTIAPQLAIISPAPQLYKLQNITLSYSANEPLSNCTYILNSKPSAPAENNSLISAEEGSSTLTLSCNDLGNNAASASVSFEADAQTPEAVAVNVSPVAGQNSLSLSWQPSNARDLGHYGIYRSSSPFSSIAAASLIGTTASTSYLDTNLASQSTYHYAVTAVDRYGNELSSVTSSSGTVADTIPPASISVAAAKVDRIAQIGLSWSRAPETDFGHYNVYRSTSNFASAASAAKIATVSNRNTRSYTDISVASATTYYYAVTASDASGNEDKSVTTASATVDDLTSPQITILQPQPQMYTMRNLTLSISASEPATCTYSLNAAPALPISGSAEITAAEGSNSIMVSCTDSSSNTGNASVSFSVDTVIPLQVQGLSVRAFNGSSLINATWIQSSASDLSHYKIYISTADFTTASDSMLLTTVVSPQYSRFGLISEQTYYLAITAIDVAGNENRTVRAAQFTIPDLNPPGIVFGLSVQPVTGTTKMLIEWSARPEQDVSHYNIYRSAIAFSTTPEAQKIGTTAGRLNNSFTDSGLQGETSYWYGIVAVDNSGNVDSRVIPLQGTTADITPPNVTITSPVNTTYSTHSVSLQYSASEEVTCRYSINGAPELPASPTITAEEGSNSLLLKCSDAASNNGTAFVQFAADTIPPPSVNVTAVQTPRKEQVILSWQQSADAGFSSYRVYRSQAPFTDAGAATLIATIAGKLQLSHADNNVQSEQAYYYAVTATDTVGNENTTVAAKAISVEDLTPPQITISSPASTTYTAYSIPLQYSASEPLSGCTYRINNNNTVGISANTTITALEGSNSLLLGCTDLNQNSGNKSVAFSANVLAPPIVTGLTVTWGSAILSWNPSPATDLKHYAIYRSMAPFASVNGAQLIAKTTGTTYHDTSVAGETTYYYAVTAVDLFDNENKAVASANFTTPDITPPAKISGLSVAAIPSQPQLQLSWAPSQAADFKQYNIYRHTAPFATTAAASLIAPISAKNSTTYVDSNLASSATYYYAVAASDLNGNEDRAVSSVAGTVADLLPPNVTTIQVASPVAGQVALQALVSDSSLSSSCEICIAQGSCSWAPAVSSFSDGSKNGTCSYLWATPNSAGTYSYNFRVSDTSGNMAEGQARSVDVLDLSEGYTVSIPLAQGWNLISFPVLPQDNSISSVMQPIRGSYTKVFYFDSSSQVWQSHFAEQGIFNPAETLTNVELGKSYWIEVLSNKTLQVTGARAPSYSAVLRQGWNLIGNPYELSIDAASSFSSLGSNYDIVFAYNASGQRWERFSPFPSISQPNTIASLVPGTGYMIDMIGEAAWNPQRS